MSDIVSIYIKDGSIDPRTAIQALPCGYAVIIKSWDEYLDSDRVTHHGYALVSRDAIEGLRYYVKVNTNKNVYPRKEVDNPSALYVKFTPYEKDLAFEAIGDVCAALKLRSPTYTPMNGYGFINFESADHVPVITGFLRRIPGLGDSVIRYGRLEVKHNSRTKGVEDHPYERREPSKLSYERKEPSKFSEEIISTNGPKPRKTQSKKPKVADGDGFIVVGSAANFEKKSVV